MHSQPPLGLTFFHTSFSSTLLSTAAASLTNSICSSSCRPIMEAANDDYTQDGSVDLHGRPVLASKTGKWKATALLVGYEAFERMAFYGIASNLVVYLTKELHEDTVSSVTNVNNWSGSVWMTPILGAYIADAYLGRFWTFTIASLIYVIGMTLLTMAVSLKSLKPSCINGICSKASTFQIAFFYIALYTIAIGTGGTKPNISTFGADQFDEFNPHEKKLKASFFNWWMFSAYFGTLFANSGLVYIQDNLSWGVGYGIPTLGLVVSLIFFYTGTPIYRHKPRIAKQSPAAEIVQVVTTAIRNWKLKIPKQLSQLHEFEPQFYASSGKEQIYHTTNFRFLDKAAIIEGSSRPPLTITQVQKAKLFCGMTVIWLALLVPSAFWAEVSTIFVKQGTMLDGHLGSSFRVPPASLSSIYTLSMIVATPFYDRCFVPFMRRKTGNLRGITILQRLGVGSAIQVIAIAIAYFVELRRLHIIKVDHITGAQDIVPMSIFWQLPQYALLGLADVFLAIGMIEFFYDQSPNAMQSLGTTFFTSAVGVGSFLNGFLVTLVDKVSRKVNGGKSWIGNNLNDSHLDYFFIFLAVLGTLNLGAFLWASSAYIYKKEKDVEKSSVDLEDKIVES
ncbi:hypothetical protein Ancab_006047 [Ancistrocladus abbreviatus]